MIQGMGAEHYSGKLQFKMLQFLGSRAEAENSSLR